MQSDNPNPNPYSLMLLKLLSVFAVTTACILPVWGANTAAITAGNVQVSGIPEDWSSRHVVFSNPGTADEATQAGRYAEWSATVNDPRYKIQQIRRAMPIEQTRAFRPGFAGTGNTQDAGMMGAPLLPQALSPWRSGNRTVRGVAQLAIVVVMVSAVVLFWRRSWASVFTLVVTAAMFLSLTSCKVAGTSPLAGGASGLALDWTMLPTIAAVGNADVFPAKYSSSGTSGASCSDYVVYPTGVAGSATVSSIVAYTNLYTGCTTDANVPDVLAAVNLDAGTVVTSPVLSLDGTQVAFVATIGTTASLVVMNLPASPTGVANTQITSKSATTNASSPCTACADWAAFNPANADTTSSPYYDYAANVIYVGDAKGVLHKFQNVFHSYSGGTNTTEVNEVSSGGFPATVLANDPLSSPVYDSGTSKLVFVGIDTMNSGIASVSSTGTVVKSVQLNKANTTHSFDVIVDSSAELVYVFTAHGNGATHDTANVALLPAAFTNATAASFAYLGTGGAAGLDSQIMYIGGFDNGYYTSGTPTAPSGNLYVCADSINASTASVAPTLFRVAISSGAFGTVSTGPVLGGTGTLGNCSPTEEFYNGTSDLIFVSQQGTNITAAPISCSSGTGCLMSFDVSNATQTFSTTAPTTANTALETSGTTGIIIDNSASSPTGSANIYFSTLGSQSCTRTVTGDDMSGSKSITATSGIFTSGDAGASISGTGIPGNTSINSVTDSTDAAMSKGGTGQAGNGVTFTITDSGSCAIQTLQTNF